MNYASIRKHDIANGEGVRVSLFVSGCRHRCRGCFNEEAQSFDYGEPFTPEVEDEIIEAMKPGYIAGLTLLGGEPMEPENQRVLVPFLKRVFAEPELKKKTLWVYTGCIFEDLGGRSGLYRTEVTDEFLSMIDVLVDGPFIEELKDISLQFRGSSNQRILKLKPNPCTRA